LQRGGPAPHRGDLPLLEQILVDDFVGVAPLGFLLSGQEWLARHATGDMWYAAHTLDEAASVFARYTQRATYRGNPPNAQLRTTVVFIRQLGEHGRWRLAGSTAARSASQRRARAPK